MLCRFGNEKTLVHLAIQYPWLIFRGHVRTCGLRFYCFGFNRGFNIPLFFFDALCPSDTEHRSMFSIVVELPDLLYPSVESIFPSRCHRCTIPTLCLSSNNNTCCPFPLCRMCSR